MVVHYRTGHRRPQWRRPVYLVLTCAALGLLIFGTYDLWHRFRATRATTTAPDAVAGQTATIPSETKIDTKTTKYSVAADTPRFISIHTIDTEGFIQQVGILPKTKQMDVPSNIHLAGWYNKSAKPGDAGLSIIDGHVIGRYTDGIFKHLSDLKPQDHFWVEYGDGSRRNFEVVSVGSYTLKDAAKVLFARRSDIKQQLNLITCDGSYDKNIRQYDRRTIVVARFVSS